MSIGSGEYRRTARVSYILMLASLGIYLIVGSIGVYIRDWRLVWTMSGGSIVLAAPFWLIRTGHFARET